MECESESPLSRAEWRVRETEQRIEMQRALLERLKARGNTKSAEITEEFLAILETDLQVALTDLSLERTINIIRSR
jgi:hypothetical protein